MPTAKKAKPKNKEHAKREPNVSRIAIDSTRRFHTLKILLLLFIMFILAAYLTFLIFINYKVIDSKELNTSAIIVPAGVAFQIEKGNLAFGKNVPGGEATRYFDIASRERALVKIIVTGNISSMVYFSENDFILEVNESRKVTASLIVPEGQAFGEYSGKIRVYLLKP